METAITKTTDLTLEYAPFKAELEICEKDFEAVKAIEIIDSKTLKQVRDGRMLLKNKRLAIESKRKALNEDALKWQRDNNAMAKTLTEFFEAKEEVLQLKQDAYTQEQERIRQEEARKEEQALNNRINALSKYGAAHDVIELKTMPDEAFEALLMQHRTAYDAEQQRIAEQKEKEAKEKEAQRLEGIRLADERKKLDEEKSFIEAEKKKIAHQKDNRYSSRTGLLNGYGCKQDGNSFISPNLESSLPTQDIYEAEDNVFNVFASDCKAQHDEIIKQKAIAEEQAKIERERKQNEAIALEKERKEKRDAQLAPDKE